MQTKDFSAYRNLNECFLICSFDKSKTTDTFNFTQTLNDMVTLSLIENVVNQLVGNNIVGPTVAGVNETRSFSGKDGFLLGFGQHHVTLNLAAQFFNILRMHMTSNKCL